MRNISLKEIKALASRADAEELDALKRSLAGDPRNGILPILEAAQKRIDGAEAEKRRICGIYEFDRSHCLREDEICVGLDEVGRGPIAGPVAVGAVVLPVSPTIEGINDSKKLSEGKREEVAAEIEKAALAHEVVFVDAAKIDDIGIAASLRSAFLDALSRIERQLGKVDHVLLDGNPLHLDEREISIVKGDAKSASIGAASIIAKVSRDNLMKEYATDYPQYGFSDNKGYGTKEHIEAIKTHGLSPIHRRSFCSGILQETLF